MEKKKLYVMCGLLLVIVLMCVLLYIKRDNFYTKINITYPDDCVEQYVNDKLITPICEDGRLLAEQQTQTSYLNIPPI